MADTEFCIGSIGAEATPIKSYVGGKPGGGLHNVIGGSYGAGVLAANVPSLWSDAEADCNGVIRVTLPCCGMFGAPDGEGLDVVPIFGNVPCKAGWAVCGCIGMCTCHRFDW